ncbi:glycosyltransferase [Eubacteriales bacterium OttesenSCG-928-N13]|nr:glycosyltransferase [Eubacteriales bacterium OttesenSCG-928-N13]
MRENGQAARVSIVIASRNEGQLLRRTLDSMQAAANDTSYEIIVVDDGSTDGSCDFLRREGHPYPARLLESGGVGLAPARNLGAAAANGDHLVICDAHIDVPPHWLDQLLHVLQQEDADAVCPAIVDMPMADARIDVMRMNVAKQAKENRMCGRTMDSLCSMRWLAPQDNSFYVPVICGGCFAIKRSAWEAVGGYESAFRGYGYDEEELSIKLWTSGFALKADPNTVVHHRFRRFAPYAIRSDDVIHNLLYLAMRHYSDARVERLMQQLLERGEDGIIAQRMYPKVFTPENIKTKREAYQKSRLHSDDWFFDAFHLPL